jgi:sugar/nucleoside kinase (ribokinase family)
VAQADFLAVGHLVRDLQPDGWRLGGTVAFAAVQAQRLGYAAAIFSATDGTAEFANDLPGIEIHAKLSPKSTTFHNTYQGGQRQQRILQQARSIHPSDIPPEWRNISVVLLGPVCSELTGTPASVFENSLVGVSAQGWLREVGPDERVRRVPWQGEPFWSGCDVLFVSEEDLGDHLEQLDRWTAEVDVVALTRAGRGARIIENGSSGDIDGFPADERDPTGAGDVFAAAFLLRYHESRQTGEAARFASAAAAFSVEGAGIDTIANRDSIQSRMAQHPDIVLK